MIGLERRSVDPAQPDSAVQPCLDAERSTLGTARYTCQLSLSPRVLYT